MNPQLLTLFESPPTQLKHWNEEETYDLFRVWVVEYCKEAPLDSQAMLDVQVFINREDTSDDVDKLTAKIVLDLINYKKIAPQNVTPLLNSLLEVTNRNWSGFQGVPQFRLRLDNMKPVVEKILCHIKHNNESLMEILDSFTCYQVLQVGAGIKDSHYINYIRDSILKFIDSI